MSERRPPGEAASGFRVVLEPHGLQFGTTRAQTVLAAARAAGIVMPSSCRNGTCRICMCHMKQGAVRYKIEWPGLSVDEKDEGWILPCVAVAQADLVLESPYAFELSDEPASQGRPGQAGAKPSGA